jgi:hypothetical protein
MPRLVEHEMMTGERKGDERKKKSTVEERKDDKREMKRQS